MTEVAQFNSFYTQVLSPQKKGRGGFPDQVAHNDIVARLQEMWGSQYEAFTADWQRWATELVRIPAHELNAAMRRGPPASLNSAFSPKQVPAEQQVQVIHEQSAISHSFLKQIAPRIEKLTGIAKKLATNVVNVQHRMHHVQRELESLSTLVANQKDIAAAYRVSSAPKKKRRARSAAEEAGISDESDQNHRFTSSDSDFDDGSDQTGAAAAE